VHPGAAVSQNWSLFLLQAPPDACIDIHKRFSTACLARPQQRLLACKSTNILLESQWLTM